jgi:adenylate cyclase
MIEIERKFLVSRLDLLTESLKSGVEIQQAYILVGEDRSLRVRLKGPRAFLTLKIGNDALKRFEFENEINKEEAMQMLTFCDRVLSKTRYELKCGNHLWEIDFFHGKLEGLVLAEIELTEESESFDKPHWLGEEVTYQPEYLNVNLIKKL